MRIRRIGSVRDQAPVEGEITKWIDGWQSVLNGTRDD